jgi:putative hydrolase of the HAD superfamily
MLPVFQPPANGRRRRALGTVRTRAPRAHRIWPVASIRPDGPRIPAVDVVIFDWGGTLTPWHSINIEQLWGAVCELHFPADEAAAHAEALCACEQELWRTAAVEHRSATMRMLFERAGVAPTDELLASYAKAWQPHTFTDPEAAGLMRWLRGRGTRIGVLSNTMWPRAWHDEVFRRDGVLDLIDGAVYTSEIDWTKPHPRAFAAAMAAVGVTDPARCVFVGDRPYDDVHGAQQLGMRTVLIPHSDVPAFESAVPDAVISRLAELRPLIESWSSVTAAPRGRGET